MEPQNLVDNRLNIIKRYIEARQNNEVSTLLSMLHTEAKLCIDEICYQGHEQLLQYYNRPQPLSPSISEPIYEDGQYSMILSFLMGVKKLKVVFVFDNSNLITEIDISSIGWI